MRAKIMLVSVLIIAGIVLILFNLNLFDDYFDDLDNRVGIDVIDNFNLNDYTTDYVSTAIEGIKNGDYVDLYNSKEDICEGKYVDTFKSMNSPDKFFLLEVTHENDKKIIKIDANSDYFLKKKTNHT